MLRTYLALWPLGTLLQGSGRRSDALAGSLIEDVHHRRIDGEPDPVARVHLRSTVRDQHDLRFARLYQVLGLRTRRLDDDSFARYGPTLASAGELQVFRANEIG